MPIEISYRKAPMGPGLVVDFKNRSNRSLSVAATFTNPTLHQEKTFRVDVPDNGVKEFGHLEGWAFASGDTIKVAHKEYKPLSVTLP
jgi:hypothetical protein